MQRKKKQKQEQKKKKKTTTYFECKNEFFLKAASIYLGFLGTRHEITLLMYWLI